MSVSIKIEDFTEEVKKQLNKACLAAITETAIEVQNSAMNTVRVDTGETRGSYSYQVDEGNLEAKVGSANENAVWEEFGTGQYAINGNGRKTPWVYVDRHGKAHKTSGKRPSRPLYTATVKNKDTLIRALKAHGIG